MTNSVSISPLSSFANDRLGVPSQSRDTKIYIACVEADCHHDKKMILSWCQEQLGMVATTYDFLSNHSSRHGHKEFLDIWRSYNEAS